jgi:hypothetical protein
LCLIGSLLTSDHDDEVLFLKAYSLKQTTIQGGAHAKPDQEMAAGHTTVSGSSDVSDERLEGHEQSLQGGAARGEQVHASATIDVIELAVLKG